jgi:group I intron endonuclease
MIDIDNIPKIGCVYKITSPSGKIYIGKTKNLKNRFLKYSRLICIQQKKLYTSLFKYGFINHSYDILFKSNDPDSLNEMEIFYINENNSFNSDYGLNLTEGGDGVRRPHSNESKNKISNSLRNSIKLKETMNSDEYRKKLSNSLKGHVGYGKGLNRTIEVREKISKTIQNNLKINGSRKHINESKLIMSENRKGENNNNSTECQIIYNENIFHFKCRKYIKNFFNRLNTDLNLRGPNRYSYDGLFNRGYTNDIKLL